MIVLCVRILLIIDLEGNEFAQFFFVHCFSIYGSFNNPKLEFRFKLNAANQGLASAQCLVGESYLHGFGCEKDYWKALMWLKKAENQENEDAIRTIKEFRNKNPNF